MRFAVVAHNGQSRTPVPTNKMFVSPIEVRFAIIVLNGASGTSPPTDVGVRFGNRDEVCGGMIVTGRRGAVPYRDLFVSDIEVNVRFLS